MKAMIQVYCDDENGVNRWLKENYSKVEVIDVKIALNELGEMVMVTYKEINQEEYFDFNLNYYTKVKLSELGKKLLHSQHVELLGKTNIEYREPEVDSEGYTKFQMWNLINKFGKHLHMGYELPFDVNIKIEKPK